jgi:NAD(P)H-dependent FMN reductase
MHIATFCGSASHQSANRRALDVVAATLDSAGHVVADAGDLAAIPMFRAELVVDPPEAVGALQTTFETADAVVLAVPEYGGGAAGWAKNCLDWMVGSGSLYGRPAAVLSAGTTGGRNAIDQIARTLTWQGALVVATLGIAAPRTKSDTDGRLTDGPTLDAIAGLADRVVAAVTTGEDDRHQMMADTVSALGIDPLDRRT